MMIGQKVECIASGGEWINEYEKEMQGPKQGDILIIKGISLIDGLTYLIFHEWPDWYDSKMFKPITDISIFTAMLNSVKKKEPVLNET